MKDNAIYLPSEQRLFLSSLIGLVLLEVRRWIPPGSRGLTMNIDRLDGVFELRFQHGKSLIADSCPELEDCLIIYEKFPKSYNLEHLENINCSSSEVWRSCNGKITTSIRIVKTNKSIESGLALKFNGDSQAYICVENDDLFATNENPFTKQYIQEIEVMQPGGLRKGSWDRNA